MPSKRRIRWAVLPIGIATAAVLAGCTPTELNGYLPGFVEDGTPTTDRTDMVSGLWVNSWIVLLAVGVITWGLMGWAAIVYRRRRGQTGLPVQLRYNMPIEIFYTIVPLILVVGFFAFTARDQAIIETQYEDPDVSITAIGNRVRLGLAGGQPLAAEITAESAERLGLRPGARVSASWKAAATRIVRT